MIYKLYYLTIYIFIISEAEAGYSTVRGANLPRLSMVRPHEPLMFRSSMQEEIFEQGKFA